MSVAPDRAVQAASNLRAVRIWLVIVAALIVCTLLVGGATRLTESGLSIVEWKPVTGTLPPLSQAEWSAEFEAYKKIPQYREMNQGMSLDEFKTIYWWEWAHRALARFIGIAFLLPFLWFLWRGAITGQLMRRLWILFALGGLQGAVGWWMVKSGLAARTSVSQYRLAVHFMLALLLFSAVVWTVRRLQSRPLLVASMRLKVTSWLLLGLVFLQLYFGALVAGLRAGKIFNTWPNIDGVLIPSFDRLFFETPWWRNFFDNMLTVQFSHRMIAYVLLAAAIYHAIDAMRLRANTVVTSGACWLLASIVLQVAIGVATLLHQVPIDMGVAHQANAIVVLTLALLQAERLNATSPKMASGPHGLAAG
ncbi:MAG: COX15/CtaA family protein [Afipia sp.]|nr:COX15/CtaA family protein [Afipia sp.]